MNATNDCNTALQIALQELIHPDLNSPRVVNTSFNSVYFSLCIEGKNVSELLQLGLRVGGIAPNEKVLPMVGKLKNLRLATEVYYLFKD